MFCMRINFQVAKQIGDVYFEDQVLKTPSPLSLTFSSCYNNIIRCTWKSVMYVSHACGLARNATLSSVAKIRVRPLTLFLPFSPTYLRITNCPDETGSCPGPYIYFHTSLLQVSLICSRDTNDICIMQYQVCYSTCYLQLFKNSLTL